MSAAKEMSGRVGSDTAFSQVGGKESSHKTNDSRVLGQCERVSRKRISSKRLAQIVAELSSQELEIVATLARLRMASASQLERLHFSVQKSSSSSRHCRRVLNRLVLLRVLARLDRSIGGVRAGSSGYVYSLDRVGQRIAGGIGPAKGRRVERPWTPSHYFIKHTLAITALFVSLTEAERDGSIKLLSFQAEPASWRYFYGAAGPVMVKPDAFIVARVGEYEELTFVEVDRATESCPAIVRKLETYRAYWASGREQSKQEVFPKVLVLVPDEGRKQVVIEAAAAQPAESWKLFQVALYDQGIDILSGKGLP